MFKARTYVPQKILIKIYTALIQAYMMYCTIQSFSRYTTARVNGQLQLTKPLFSRLEILNIYCI